MKYCYNVREEYEMFSGKDPSEYYCIKDLKKLPLYYWTAERKNDSDFCPVCDTNWKVVECKDTDEAYEVLWESLNAAVDEYFETA